MTKREKLIEAMACADFKDNFPSLSWDRQDISIQEEYTHRAAIVLSTIEAHNGGCSVVPQAATEEMAQAAHHALYQWREKQGDPQQNPDNPTKHKIRFAAMIAESPYRLEKPQMGHASTLPTGPDFGTGRGPL